MWDETSAIILRITYFNTFLMLLAVNEIALFKAKIANFVVVIFRVYNDSDYPEDAMVLLEFHIIF